MALIQCDNCGKLVSEKAKKCPSCNTKIEKQKKKFERKNFSKRKLIVGIALFVFAISFGLLYYYKLSVPSIDTVKKSVVMVEVYDSNDNLLATGSGFCVFKSDYIITNFHVIQGASNLKIVTNDNERHRVSQVLISNPTEDLAMLKADVSLKPLKLGSISGLKSGTKITAIGSPLGELNTVSTGIISNAENNKGIQITASISHGSSGGVLLDSRNRTIGVTYATLSEGQNLNYAISIKYVKEMYNAYKNDEYYTISASNSSSCYNDLSKISSTLDFQECQSTSKEYYSFSSLSVLGMTTSEEAVFSNYNNEKINYGLLNSEEKKQACAYYSALPTEKVNLSNADLNNVDLSYIILSLNEINKNDLAIGIAGISTRSGHQQFQFVNSMSLSVNSKVMLLLGYGDLVPSDLTTENNKAFIDFINNKSLSASAKGMILSRFGYEIRDGRVYY